MMMRLPTSTSRSALGVWWFLVLLPCSFGFLPYRNYNGSFRSYQYYASQEVSTTTTVTAATTATASESATERNMFHDYDKPILLIGSSSSGEKNELNELANGFLQEHFPSASVVVPYNGDLLLEEIHSRSFAWPNIVLVDFATLDDSAKEKDAKETVQRLYQDAGLLSIYVNVQHQASTELEDSVLVPYSDYELCIASQDDSEHIQWELTRLVARARLAPAIPGSTQPSSNTAHLTMGQHTFFLSLSFPEISQVQPYVNQMCKDVDAMEYRADLLDCRDSRFELLHGMQLLRQYCRPHLLRNPALPFSGSAILEDVMPIVYTVRTQHQAGTYPDDTANGIPKMFELLHWGLRGGVEVLDVESAWDPVATKALLDTAEQRYASQILGSHHVVGTEISTPEAVQLFQQCALDGKAHGAKVVLSIDSDDKDRMAHDAAMIATSLAKRDGKPVIPNISLILGDVGQFSRIINLPFTPVTHESLPFKAAPGQLSAKEIMTTRLLTKIIEPQNYCILGHNIAYSVSPQMQGAAFAAVRLPHVYGRADVETVQEFVESDFFQGDNFGGCSVTIPHKQAIIPYVDVMSDAAETIGSVNTLIAKYEVGDDDDESDVMKRVMYGDNTDWKGIFNPLERQIGVSSGGWALILGGGGTARAAAYAATKLGLNRVYYNRTPSKAADLAESFGGTVISSLDEEGKEDCLGALLQKEGATISDIRVVISTLPAGAEFVLPEWVLSSSKPVIFDVNYKPYHTKLLDQAEAAGCPVVRGSEMLWEQGVGQFELWTGRTAPYGVMKSVVLDNCLPTKDE
ncbi:Pentafunctional AROM polypeptide [Seminavis robusta]|uniref:Pentafunctional AROM polypeptide n=1 Tax=Seminavis robusta TaxID=568900 RepID=A0A9N8EWR7_9STRA|nr:Pentafunctional AROM polypeptide [Seminavis robusta]|eukprot:Sro2286_g322020.1 Pentafunctional AROM polypeptide (801) ;mRNA; r:13546-15948